MNSALVSHVPQSANDLCVRRSTCRMCASKRLTLVWSFGSTPLANAYLAASDLEKPEPSFPLDVFVCEDCHLAQLLDVVRPDILFRHYHYVSSTSGSFRAHFEAFAEHAIKRLDVSPGALVVDIGSNDGILLKPFKARGMQTLGVDPAENVAAIAKADGIETTVAFFTPDVARQIVRERGHAALVTANNVFAHTDDVDSFALGARELIGPAGAFIFEVQYLGDLLEKNLFDIVYHEHLCYYHVTPLVAFFARHAMEIFDVERPSVHGGSIRVYVQHAGGPRPRDAHVDSILDDEEKRGLNTLVPFERFFENIQENKRQLRRIVQDIKATGKRIVGYGAPAKATTLLSTFGLDGSDIEYIVDDDRKIKQGMFMPGTHIPILAPEKLYEDRPDYCLVLAWNFAEQIMSAHKAFTDQGGKFIIPTPHPVVR